MMITTTYPPLMTEIKTPMQLLFSDPFVEIRQCKIHLDISKPPTHISNPVIVHSFKYSA